MPPRPSPSSNPSHLQQCERSRPKSAPLWDAPPAADEAGGRRHSKWPASLRRTGKEGLLLLLRDLALSSTFSFVTDSRACPTTSACPAQLLRSDLSQSNQYHHHHLLLHRTCLLSRCPLWPPRGNPPSPATAAGRLLSLLPTPVPVLGCTAPLSLWTSATTLTRCAWQCKTLAFARGLPDRRAKDGHASATRPSIASTDRPTFTSRHHPCRNRNLFAHL